MGVPSLNDLAVDGVLNTTNPPTNLRWTNVKPKHLNQSLDLFLKWTPSWSEVTDSGAVHFPLRAASHYTISVVRRIRLDAICHDGSSQVSVANDWHRDPCDAPSRTTRLISHDYVKSHNLPRCLRYFWTCSKCYDGLRYTLIVRIAADRIAEGLTLHDVLSATASWGAIAGRRKLKIV